ncbi:unnamed protein product, partial [Oppiella nova]
MKIAPKLLSVFNSGLISEYIDFRYLNTSDDHNPKTVALLAQKLAKFHSLNIPIPKTVLKKPQSLLEGKVRQEIVAKNLTTFLTLNLLDEMPWIGERVLRVKSPVVFSHNDFNRTNILIRESNDNKSQNLEIFFIDFDYSNYNYRGYDLGKYFSTWAQEIPEYCAGPNVQFPTDTQMSVFIEAYIEEMVNIYGNSYVNNEINSIDSIIREAKSKAEIGFNCYRKLKNRVLQEYPHLN